MIPSIGRIVHYVLPEGHKNKGGHRAAQITAVYGDAEGKITEATPVDLRVTLQAHEPQGTAFGGPEGFIDAESVFPDPKGTKPGTYHEPERVEQPVQGAKPQEAAATGAKK